MAPTAPADTRYCLPRKETSSRLLSHRADGLRHRAAIYAAKKGITRGSRDLNPTYTDPVIPVIKKIFFSFLLGLTMAPTCF